MRSPRGLAGIGQAASGAGPVPADRRRLRHELRPAALQSAFALWLQPRFSLADGTLCGAEAQTRWPRRGSIGTPASFMPMAEECGLADEVTGWSIAASCGAASAWLPGFSDAPDPPAPYVSVSVTHGMEPAALLGHVAKALARTCLAPDRLHIEIPIQSRRLADEDLAFMLSALADCGIGTVLAGFGGAIADLLPLKMLPLTAVKLDRSLIRELPHDRSAGALASCTIAYAHGLGAFVIAEGVETVQQREFLRKAGCDQAQGGLFGGFTSAELYVRQGTSQTV